MIIIVGLLLGIVILTSAVVLWVAAVDRWEPDEGLRVDRSVRDAQRRIDAVVRQTITEARREAYRQRRS